MEIKGIAYDVNESTDDIVLKVAKDMGLVLKKSDIRITGFPPNTSL